MIESEFFWFYAWQQLFWTPAEEYEKKADEKDGWDTVPRKKS